MKFYRQSPNACLAYSALAIGAVDREAVDMYEKGLATIGLDSRMQANWAANYAPWLSPVIANDIGSRVGRPVSAVPVMNGKPVGRGVAIIVAERWPFAMNHAVAYERGRYMDCDRSSGNAETWKELIARYESEGYTNIRLVDYARAP